MMEVLVVAKILITGALGQIGSELASGLRGRYGTDQVVVSDIVKKDVPVANEGPFELLNVTDAQRMAELVRKHQVDWVVHLAAILSATGEKNPTLAWNVNMGGLFNVLEVARETGVSLSRSHGRPGCPPRSHRQDAGCLPRVPHPAPPSRHRW